VPRVSAHTTHVGPGPLRSSLTACACLLRSVPLFFRAAPKTPLRVLCIVALDTVRVLRGSPPLSRQRRKDLATFLDFQACTNMEWDRKPFWVSECEALRRRLEQAGLGRWISDYLRLLSDLETRRPSASGDATRCDQVRSYREAVARLTLATVVAIATDADDIEDGLRMTDDDHDIAMLLRMAMQCQIVDDVVDYREDLKTGLPSFLTASLSIHDALASTVHAARAYGSRRPIGERSAFPLEAALTSLTALAQVALLAAHAFPAQLLSPRGIPQASQDRSTVASPGARFTTEPLGVTPNGAAPPGAQATPVAGGLRRAPGGAVRRQDPQPPSFETRS
jgi:hypothetical protein